MDKDALIIRYFIDNGMHRDYTNHVLACKDKDEANKYISNMVEVFLMVYETPICKTIQ